MAGRRYAPPPPVPPRPPARGENTPQPPHQEPIVAGARILIDTQITWIEQELVRRRLAYPQMIAKHQMEPGRAAADLQVLVAILASLRAFKIMAAERQGKHNLVMSFTTAEARKAMIELIQEATGGVPFDETKPETLA